MNQENLSELPKPKEEKYGLFKGMSDIEYHFERDDMSSSALKVISKKSAAHYYYQFLDPEYKAERLQQKRDVMSGKNTKKAHLRFGDCFHKLLLEPKEFEKKVVLWSGLPRNKKEGKDEFNKIMENFEDGMLTMTEAEHKSAQEMAESVLSLSTARDFIHADGDAEASLFWHDETYGIDCKARVDYLTHDGFLIDLKTAQNSDHEGFRKDAYNFGYYIQAAWYMRGYEAVFGKKPKGFCFIAIEKEKPYVAGTYYATDDELMLGHYDIERALEEYSLSKKSGSWRGYPDKFVPLGLPAWGKKRLEEGD